jgi:hypothetical protein
VDLDNFNDDIRDVQEAEAHYCAMILHLSIPSINASFHEPPNHTVLSV